MEEAESMAEEIRRCDGGVFTVKNLLEKFAKFEEKISIGELIQILPKQKMRAYSICSSPLVDAKKISIVVSRVDDCALASVFLSDTVRVNDTLLVNLRQGTFRLPALPAQAVIMICAGTGFAPFRAFLSELKLRSRIAKDKSLLFFGCRNKAQWIYRKEMEEFESLGGKLCVAFSREGEKEYVQHKVEEELETLEELVNKRNGIVYVCGSTAMGLAVMEVIGRITSIEDMRTEKRYIEELWG
jgi:sulfite reductase alpha subunit-like flavoprotein